jgi:hypothetical protein
VYVSWQYGTNRVLQTKELDSQSFTTMSMTASGVTLSLQRFKNHDEGSCARTNKEECKWDPAEDSVRSDLACLCASLVFFAHDERLPILLGDFYWVSRVLLLLFKVLSCIGKAFSL